MEGIYITNEKIQKIEDDITNTKSKIANLTAKLRKLESEKEARKNAEFLAIVNGADITPDELMTFIKAQREQFVKNDKEDDDENI